MCQSVFTVRAFGESAVSRHLERRFDSLTRVSKVVSIEVCLIVTALLLQKVLCVSRRGLAATLEGFDSFLLVNPRFVENEFIKFLIESLILVFHFLQNAAKLL
jgi:hypothetical protein